MDIIDKLGIDLKLLIAQIVNFTILFFVLKKLLYKPILDLLDKRKRMIEKNVEDTQKIEERLNKVEEERGDILKEASENAIAVIEEAKKQAEAEKEKAVNNAKKEISTLAERYRAQLKSEKEEMLVELKGEIADLVVSACEKIIRKEFSDSDQKRLEQAIKEEFKTVKI